MEYRIEIITKEDGLFWARFLDTTEIWATGETVSDAIRGLAALLED